MRQKSILEAFCRIRDDKFVGGRTTTKTTRVNDDGSAQVFLFHGAFEDENILRWELVFVLIKMITQVSLREVSCVGKELQIYTERHSK